MLGRHTSLNVLLNEARCLKKKNKKTYFLAPVFDQAFRLKQNKNKNKQMLEIIEGADAKPATRSHRDGECTGGSGAYCAAAGDGWLRMSRCAL